jgi:hypothetical protein
MSDSELKDTQPTRSLHDTQPNSRLPLEKKGLPRWMVALSVVLILAIGLLAGYGSGMGLRHTAQDTIVTGQLDEQFQLGTQAVEAGNYTLARQYFEGILRTDSNYPGLQAAYTDLLVRMHITPTALFSPTPYLSPTPDLRGAEEIYNTALQLINSADWNGAIANLDALRKVNPTYQTAQVDGLYYTALRQRGVAKIAAACQDVNLEGGIYDLTLAEHFVGAGNLDSVAESLRTYARLYIIAASFWDQDWMQVQSFFAEVMTGYPNMVDSSCKSATSRWVEATLHVAEQYLAAGDACAAEEQYAAAFAVSDPLNEAVYPTATQVSDLCHGGDAGEAAGETPAATWTPSETPIGTLPALPTETPTGVPSALPTETPTGTPTPTCDPTTPCP